MISLEDLVVDAWLAFAEIVTTYDGYARQWVNVAIT